MIIAMSSERKIGRCPILSSPELHRAMNNPAPNMVGIAVTGVKMNFCCGAPARYSPTIRPPIVTK